MTASNLLTSGSIFGFDRVQESRGTRKLKVRAQGAKFVPNPVALADMSASEMAQVVDQASMGTNFGLIYEFHTGSNAASEPANPGNSLCMVAVKKVSVVCGREEVLIIAQH